MYTPDNLPPKRKEMFDVVTDLGLMARKSPKLTKKTKNHLGEKESVFKTFCFDEASDHRDVTLSFNCYIFWAGEAGMFGEKNPHASQNPWPLSGAKPHSIYHKVVRLLLWTISLVWKNSA